jgi:acyl-CoA-binding protein
VDILSRRCAGSALGNIEYLLYTFSFFARIFYATLAACAVAYPLLREVTRDTGDQSRWKVGSAHFIYQEKNMSLQAQFDQAVADSKNLPERPDNMTLLKIYALFKQASTGDVDGKRPGFTDMVGRAKYDAWDALKGTSKDDAMQQYIDLISELKG